MGLGVIGIAGGATRFIPDGVRGVAKGFEDSVAAAEAAPINEAAAAAPSNPPRLGQRLGVGHQQLPAELIDKSPEDLEAYLRAHPESVAVVDSLLTKEGDLTDQERAVVEAQARMDSDLLNQGLDKEPSSAALEDIEAAQQRLALINSHTAESGELTEGAHAYTFAWMNEVGAEGLAKLSQVVTDSVYRTSHPPSVTQGDFNRYLTPVSDAILNLSNGEYQDNVLPENQGTTYDFDLNRDGQIDKEDMPQAVQDLVEMRIGERQNGYRAGSINENGMPSMDTVENLDRFEGWSDLMASSTVEGGREFSVDLAEQAIQAKQDMNAILTKTSSMTSYSSLTPEQWSELESSLSDMGSSRLLSVASRNEDASSDLLLDDAHRQQLLGMNWDWGQGAGDVIRAGTDRDPADGGGTTVQARAALEVMSEIASDPREYMDRATDESVSDAIVDVGITWVDSFGENVGSGTESDYHINDTDMLGRDLPLSVTLSDADQEGFLQFVASAGDEDAIRFEAASQYYGQQLISDALALDPGNPDVLDNALEWAGRADGQIRQANLEWAMDGQEDEHAQMAARLEAHNRSVAAANTVAKVTLSVGNTIGGKAFPPAAPFLGVGNALAGPIIDGLLSQEPIPDYEGMETEELNRRLEEDAIDSTSRRNYLLAQVAMANGQTGDPHLYNEDRSLKTLQEIRNINSPVNGLDELEALAESVIRDWNSHQPPHQQVDIDQFDAARDDTFAPARADNDRENNDSWRNDRIAERNLYGDNVPEGYGDDPWEDGPREMYPDENGQIGRNAWNNW